jgi:N-ethylmaleimide reductase
MSSSDPVLTPFSHRGTVYKNRVGLAPLTRGRATEDGCVGKLHAEYYSQRSSGGFILTEATGISRRGLGWFKAPGIYTEAQTEAWKEVTDAVHKKDGKIFCQLWHMGRAGHSDLFGAPPLSASATALSGEVTVKNHQKKPYETAQEMTVEDINTTIEEYKQAAKNALAAGFDGVQIHSANGYLIDQFLQPPTNQRTDDYGGSLEKRLRFLKEVIEAVVSVATPEKTWIRFSPNGSYQEMGHDTSNETFDAAIQLAASYKLGCVEVMDGVTFGFHEKTTRYDLERVRKNVQIGNPDTANPTAVMGNVGHTQESANKEIGDGFADFISFGRDYMSNPDLPERFAQGIALAPQPEYVDWWTKEDHDGYTTFPRATPEVETSSKDKKKGSIFAKILSLVRRGD